MKLETRVLKLVIAPPRTPIFEESVTTVEIDDEAAGEFIVIKQPRPDAKQGQVAFDPNEWPAIRAAVDKLVRDCKTY